MGIRLTFGVFFKSIESQFSLTRAITSAIFSTTMLIGAAVAVLAGWASDRYGPRIVVLFMGLFAGLSLLLTSQTGAAWQLFITYSLLLSIGTGATYVVAMSVVSKWFTEKRGLALGIAGSGSGVGAIVFAPLATYLISFFDWRTAYIIIGIIAWFIVVPLSRLLRRAPGEIKANSIEAEQKRPESKEDSTQPASLSVMQAFRTRNFWFLMFIWLFHGFVTFLVSTHIVPHVTDMGISEVRAAIVLSLQGGVSIIGGILMGFTTDRIGSKMSVGICALLRTVAMVWLIFSQDLWMFYLFSLVYGFATGGIAIGTAALIGDAFGLQKIGAIMGMLTIGFAAGSAIGPALGGLAFDVTDSYFSAFLSGAIAMLLVAVLTFSIRGEADKDA